MRKSTVLFTVCLLAASSSVALQPALPAMTPSVRLERRVLTDHRRLHERAPQLFGDVFGDTTTPGSTSSTTTSTTTTSTTPTSTSTSTTTSSSTTSTSTTTSTTATTSAKSTTSSSSVVMVTSTLPASSTTTAAAAATSAADTGSTSSGGGHLGLIIGVSVVGGIALLGALVFLYMKFGVRRFSDYEHDDSDIKWPELKADENAAAMQPLPARRTGGAGFDMGDESDNGHEGLMMGAVAGDAHSMNDYGGKAHDSMLGSSTALHTPGGNSAYGNTGYGGHMDTVYDDENAMAANHYDQAGVTGYYDPYSTNGGYAPHGQQQMFYPEQGNGAHEYGAQDYGAGQGGYGNYGQHTGYEASTSPPPNPYHMNGGGRTGGY